MKGNYRNRYQSAIRTEENWVLTLNLIQCYNQIPPSERAGKRSSVAEGKFSWEKREIKNLKKVLTQTKTHDIISELRLRDTATNAKQICDVSKASLQRSCSLSAVAQCLPAWKQFPESKLSEITFTHESALFVPWQINSNATLKILKEKVREDKALKKIQRTRNSRKQAKANLTVSHLAWGQIDG